MPDVPDKIEANTSHVAKPMRLGTKFLQLSLLAFLSLLYLATLQSGYKYPPTTDFAKFYGAAELLRQGQDSYAPLAIDALGPLPPDAKITRPTLHPNLNLPIITALFVPFTFLGYPTGFLIFSLLSISCGYAAILITASASQSKPLSIISALWLLVLLLGYFPTWTTVKLGQVSLFLFLLLATAWTAARRGHDMAAGIAIGLALLLKPFVFVLIPLLLARRRWPTVAWCLSIFGAGMLISLAAFGVDAHVAYVKTLGDITWYSVNWNASLLGFFTRFFGGSENTPWIDAPWIATSLSYAVSLVLIAVLTWLSWDRKGNSGNQMFDLGFGLSLVIMLLAAPLGWMYYFPVLFIAFFVTWSALSVERTARHRSLRYVLLMAFVLGTVPMPLVPASDMNSPVAWFTWTAVYFYSILILLVCVLALMLSRRPAPQSGSLAKIEDHDSLRNQ